MIKAQVITSWVGSGVTGNPYRAKLGDDHLLLNWEDVTGQDSQNITPDPNMVVIECIVTDDVFTAIEADNTAVILWDEPYEES